MIGAILLIALYAFLIIGGVSGWVLNIVHIVDQLHGPFTALLAVELVGVFVAPLGAVLGWVV